MEVSELSPGLFSSHSTFSLGDLILGFQLQSQDPKWKCLLGTSPCAALTQAQVQSQLPSPDAPLPSTGRSLYPWLPKSTLHHPQIPTPVSLTGQARGFYRVHLQTLTPCLHAFCQASESGPPATPELPCALVPLHACACQAGSSWKSDLEDLCPYLPHSQELDPPPF